MIVVLACTLAGAASRQDAEKHVFVTAMDKEGRPIVGLAARHFAVREIGSLIAAGEGDRERGQMLEQGTSATGGGRQRVTSSLALEAALTRTATELENSYRVTFARPGSARMQDLQVGVLVEGVTLRATAAPFGTR